MIRTLLIACFALLPFTAFVQSITYWPDSAAWWQVQEYTDNGNPTGNYRYYSIGDDTVILGQTYQKMLLATSVTGTPAFFAGSRVDALDRVYAFFKDSIAEKLIYDFGAEIGDTVYGLYYGNPFMGPGDIDVVVISRDTQPWAGGLRVSMMVQEIGGGPGFEFWHSTHGNSNEPLHPRYGGVVSGDWYLNCMRYHNHMAVNGGPSPGVVCNLPVSIHEPLPGPEIAPNPTTGMLNLRPGRWPEPVRTELRDLHGRSLMQWETLPHRIDMSGLPSGLYFLRFNTDGLHHTEKIIKD